MPKKVDASQASIVAVAREMGASVTDLHEVGRGVCDLLLGWRGHPLLIEVKGERGKLTNVQIAWQDEMRCPVHIVHSADEMTALLLAICCTCGSRAEYMHPARWRCQCGNVWDGGQHG